MRILSCFHDETGEQNMSAGYYMVVMVMHDQADSLDGYIAAYEERLARLGLDDIPFHMADLLHGQEDYKGLKLADRKRMLVAFNAFVRSIPVTYQVFAYTNFDVKDEIQLAARLEKDIEAFLKDSLEHLQQYDEVAIYYDGGHKAVSTALRNAFKRTLSKKAPVFKTARYQEKRLSQFADFFCSIELAATRYASGRISPTYNKFFGSWRDFRANYLKQARRKRFSITPF